MEYNMISDYPDVKRRKKDILGGSLELDLHAYKGVSEEQQTADENCEMKRLFGEMLNSQFTDVKVKCGTIQISAHKSVLFGRIPFIKDALIHDTTGKPIIQVPPEISPDVLRLIIQHAYFIYPKVTLQNAQALLEAAAFFRIEDLWAFCDQFIAKRIVLTVENCLAARSYATIYSAKVSIGKADLFMAEHLAAVSDIDPFKCMNETEIVSVLSMKDLELLPNEELYWDALVKWIEADVENRKPLMLKLVRLIRLPCLSEHVISSKVLSHPYIEGDSVCRELVNDLLLYKTDPSNPVLKQRCEAAFNSMRQRCRQIDHIYQFYTCKTDDRLHSRIQALKGPDGEWVQKCWKSFPEECNPEFVKFATVKYRIYCVNKDNDLLCYNSITEVWTVIQGDGGRPDGAFVDMELGCLNGKLVICGPTFSGEPLQMMFWCYDPPTNSWSQTTLIWPDDLNFEISACFGITIGDQGDEVLCVAYYRFQCCLLLFFDVQTGNLVKRGRKGRIGLHDRCPAVAHWNGKVFVAASVKYYAMLGDDDSDNDSDTDIGPDTYIKVYDIALNKWGSLQNPNASAECLISLAVANSRLYRSICQDDDHYGYPVKYLDLTETKSGWQDGSKLVADASVKRNFRNSAVVCRYP